MSRTNLAPRAAYIHVPFCRHRCGYCNFTVVAGRDDLVDDFLRGIECELARLAAPRPVDTLFIGGGTPTHLGVDRLRALFDIVTRWFPPADNYELTIEANPIDLTPEMIDLLADLGVNRLSIGGQSFDATKLERLERDHSPARLTAAIQDAKQRLLAVSVDLIFGAPGEQMAGWLRDLATLIDLGPQHISTYGLTFEKGTMFWSRRERGELQSLGEDAEGEMYEAAIDRLTAAGYEHYEVSNFAIPGFRCRHNEAYWAGDEYYAAGPGAARFVDGRREMNHRSATTWLRRALAGDSVVAESEQLDAENRARELLVFMLRRLEGVERERFAAKAGFCVDQLTGPLLPRFVEQGLLHDDGRRVRLSRRGLLVSDAIWPFFLRR